MSQHRFMTPVVAEVLDSDLRRATPTESTGRHRPSEPAVTIPLNHRYGEVADGRERPRASRPPVAVLSGVRRTGR
jgi:hypothetical protein